ncbi:MAG: glucose PTS transporter subunit IIA [Clostridiales bacterium]|nr:glucose PTS transporter subunit IIA [Clostridiales bacterium]
MAQTRDYAKLAVDIIQAVGGEANIIDATRCATRLRLVLEKVPEDAKEKISKMPGVITVVEGGGQFQVVIGAHVTDVFQKVSEELRLDEKEGEPAKKAKENIFNRAMAAISAAITPFLYILAGAGMLQGILIVITVLFPGFSSTGTYEVLNFMSWTPFTFLPVFIAVSASRYFKCNTYIAVLCCCALVNPTLTEMAGRITNGETIRFLFFRLSETVYTSSVLPPLFLVWMLSYVEHFIEKRLPDTLKALFTPLICLIIMVPFTLLFVGPLTSVGADAIAEGYNLLYGIAPILAGAIISGFWEVVVIFGIHWGVVPMIMANLEMNGYDSFQVFQTVAVVAQVGAVFGCFVKSHNRELKKDALTAGITGITGITEPTIYGVTLRLKKPFFCGCIAAAAGSVVASLFHSVYYVFAGLPGFLTMVNSISSENPMSFWGVVAGCLVSSIGAFLLVQIVGFDDPVSSDQLPDEVKTRPNDTESQSTIYAPMSGNVIPLSEVPDQVFSSGMLGGGAAIEPSEYKVYAPFNGKIDSIFDTKHAIGLISEDGMECMIHVGLDTVKLEGRHFTVLKKAGDSIKTGDLILEFDGAAIKEEGYPLVTIILVTNSNQYKEVLPVAMGQIRHEAALLSVAGSIN